jgi:hypothetical protein
VGDIQAYGRKVERAEQREFGLSWRTRF